MMKTDNHTNKEREQQVYKVTIVGSIVNVLLTLLKLVAGIVGHSAAMIADAVHSLSDFVTDIIVLVFVKISNKPKDHSHNYGHGKFETLATVFIGLILAGVAIGIAWGGIREIIFVVKGNILPRPGFVALIAAGVSIVLKEILYRYTVIRGRQLKSSVVVANAWHHRSDALSSIGTAIGIGGAIFLGDKWTVLDPIAALIVGIFILRVAWQLIKPCLDELLERSLPDETKKEIETIINSVEEVSHLHHLHTRKIGYNYAIEFHVRLNGNLSLTEAHHIVTQIEDKLKQQYGQGTHVTIHMEPLVEI